MDLWSRRVYLQDVKSLKEIIESFPVTGDFKGINDIIEVIENNQKGIIDYKLAQFCFHLKGAIAGARPADLHYCKIELENRFALKDVLTDNIDPLFLYSLDIKVSLFKSENNQRIEHCCTWHLDKEDKELDFSYHHPYYHIQFGGKKHEYLDPAMAVLGSPRLPHPPMDIILAFHFIINNFVDRKRFDYVDNIMRDYRYSKIIQNSIKRLWEPYFNGYSKAYNHNDYKINKLFPLYIN